MGIQPGSDVCGVTRGVATEDIIGIPFAMKGIHDCSVAELLGIFASGVGSCVGTFEDLHSS